MDKYEYRVRSEEIDKLMSKEKYAEAANVADMIDWRKVKNISTLLKIADLYKKNTRNEDCRDILLLAYEKYPTNRTVVYNLCEVSIELYDVVAAIQYYNLYTKIAPKDNGVIILHYRILEAQEASLEERIALLEDLKKKDYQEEWGYELAYLYHRVGLGTKCAEECDQVVLWFGHGPYVMKALELKKLHMPLTESQQKKYDAMLGNAQEDYGEDVYADGSYDEDGNYIEETYTQDAYVDGSYDADGNYIEETYTQDAYANGGYDANGNYIEETYTQDAYAYDAYGTDNDGYNESGGYAEESYAENNDTENNYSGEYYNDAYYNDQFYTEQTYDGSDNPVIYEDDVNNNYTTNMANNLQPSSNVDMSLYNTINLQKVVAEGMKELFSDSDDVFAEEREAFEDSEPIAEELAAEEPQEKEILEISAEEFLQEETQAEELADGEIVEEEAVTEEAAEEKAVEEEEATEEEAVTEETAKEEVAEEEACEPESSQTGKMAMMLEDVSEAAPGPDTGAVRTVFVPGENARAIKADLDMKELRDTTERSVNEEHTRMEKNSENVYRDTELYNTEVAEEPVFQPMTGQMNINDVLLEWENIKLDNAKKHQEEIKQRVLSQTGKIFANFDDSLKSGILGELEKEENNTANSAPEEKVVAANGEEYDVSYVLPGSNEQIVTEIEAVLAKELGATRVVPQEEINRELAQMQNEEVSAEESFEAAQTDETLYDETGADETGEVFAETGEEYGEIGEYYEESSDAYENAEEHYEESQPEDEADYEESQTEDEAVGYDEAEVG
ncbi:MAG: hypothetical protein K2N89_09635, partial [Lachnospiraceae bacterium]|nr:hypothetical protein [Lachnospiraceae bacterium]